MILVNTTFVVSECADTAFLHWAKAEFMPALATQGFEGVYLCRVLADDDPSSRTYALQLRAPSRDAFGKWDTATGRILTDNLLRSVPRESVLSFTTTLGIIASM